jgi:hypothetical protein
MCYSYHIFGLNIKSVIPLPAIPDLHPQITHDVAITYGKTPDALANPQFKGVRFQAGNGEFLPSCRNRHGAALYENPRCLYRCADNMPLIPYTASKGALYFIRNPLDVAVSFARHNGSDCDIAISTMADEAFAFCCKLNRLHSQLRQKLLSWSGHVRSWVDNAPFPVCVLRYEDMKTKPLETFQKAVRFAGLPHSLDQIQKAIDFSAFDVVQQQEASEGFQENSTSPSRFFRKGLIGSWREELSENQVQRIVRDHRDVMHRFGYLEE